MKRFYLILTGFLSIGAMQAQATDRWVAILGQPKTAPDVTNLYDTYALGQNGFNDETGLEILFDDSNYVKTLVFTTRKFEGELPFGAGEKTLKADFTAALGKPEYSRKSGDYFQYGYRSRDTEVWLECKDKKCEKPVEIRMTYIASSFTKRTNGVWNTTNSATDALSALDKMTLQLDSIYTQSVVQGASFLTRSPLPEASDEPGMWVGSVKPDGAVSAYLHHKGEKSFLYRVVLKQYSAAEFPTSEQDVSRMLESLNTRGRLKNWMEYTGTSFTPPDQGTSAANLIAVRPVASGATQYEELILWESSKDGLRYLEYRYVSNW